jgi:hypothetical protein
MSFYNKKLNTLLHNKVKVSVSVDDYLAAYEITMSLLCKAENISLSFEDKLTKRLFSKTHSLVSLKEMWNPYPSLENRIENAMQKDVPSTNHAPVSAWELIPTELKNKVSAPAVNQDDNQGSTQLVHYRIWLSTDMEKWYIPMALQPYFDRDIVDFDVDSVTKQETSSPVNDENSTLINKYLAAQRDLDALYDIKHGKIPTSAFFYYDGKAFRPKDAPITAHEQYLDELRKQTKAVDMQMYQYLWTVAKDKDALVNNYKYMLYGRTMLHDYLYSLKRKREKFIEELKELKEPDAQDIADLNSFVRDYENVLQKALGHVNYDLACVVLKDDVADAIRQWTATNHTSSVRINEKEVEMMLTVSYILIDIHERLYAMGKTNVYHAFLSSWQRA